MPKRPEDSGLEKHYISKRVKDLHHSPTFSMKDGEGDDQSNGTQDEATRL